MGILLMKKPIMTESEGLYLKKETLSFRVKHMIVAYIVCGEIEYEKTVWQGDGKMFWRVGEKKRDNRLETGEQKDCNVMKTGGEREKIPAGSRRGACFENGNGITKPDTKLIPNSNQTSDQTRG